MKKIVTVAGSPGSGKTTLCMNLNQTLSSMGKSVFYAHEWVKDWANRSVKITPADQFMIFGNQVGLISSGIASEVDLVTSCTSPELCAFYAEYASGFQGRFKSFVEGAKEFEAEALRLGYSTKKVFLYRSPEMYRRYYKPNGRWHSLEESLGMQDRMADWFVSNFSNVEIKEDIDVFSLINELSFKEQE